MCEKLQIKVCLYVIVSNRARVVLCAGDIGWGGVIKATEHYVWVFCARVLCEANLYITAEFANEVIWVCYVVV